MGLPEFKPEELLVGFEIFKNLISKDFVPYTGAVKDVDLGDFDLTAEDGVFNGTVTIDDQLTVNDNVVIDGKADVIQLRVQAHSTQSTFDPIVFENSAGTDFFVVGIDGTTIIGDGAAGDSTLRFLEEGTANIIMGWDASLDKFVMSTNTSLDGTNEHLTMSSIATVINATNDDHDFIYRGDTDNNLIRGDAGNDRVGIGVAVPSAKLHIDQSSTTGAIPVLFLDQADISEEMIKFDTTIGTGNAIEAIGAKTLTTTHFIKVLIPGGLTRYFPVGTIA